MDMEERVVINVGGTRHDVRQETLRRIPGTKLASLTKRTFHSDDEVKEYYFDRNSAYFEVVLDCLRTGQLHIPRNLCVKRVQQELDFWKIDRKEVGSCCLHIFTDAEEQETEALEMSKEFGLIPMNDDQMTEKLIGVSSRRIRLWTFLSDPNSSKAALAWLYFYLILVVLTIICTALGTDNNLRIGKYLGNISLDEEALAAEFDISLKRLQLTISSKPQWMHIIDNVALLFFSTELFIRFVVSPMKGRFFKDPMNIIDIIWIILNLTIIVTTPFQESNLDLFIFAVIVDGIVSVLRVFKILRVASCWLGLRVLLLTLKASIKELLLMIVFLGMGLVIFGTFIYYSELDEMEGQFPNILVGYWWAVVTMTTVGYGDIHPTGAVGRIVGAICIIIGMVITSLPISIIGNNFSKYLSFSKTVKVLRKKNDRNHKK